MAKEAVSKPLRHVARKPLSSALRGSSPFPGATLLGEFIITSPESHIGGIDFIQEDMIRKARTAIEKVLEFRELP